MCIEFSQRCGCCYAKKSGHHRHMKEDRLVVGSAITNTWTRISNCLHTAFGMRCHQYSGSGKGMGLIQVLGNNRTDIVASPEMSCERTIDSVRVALRRVGKSCNRMTIQLTINHRSHLRSSVDLGSVSFSSLDPSPVSLGEL